MAVIKIYIKMPVHVNILKIKFKNTLCLRRLQNCLALKESCKPWTTMKKQTSIEKNGSKLLRQKKYVMFKRKNEEGTMAARRCTLQ